MIKPVRLGRITIDSFPRKALQIEPEADPCPYLRALKELCGLLAPDSWALAGGLAVPIALGRFYRKHADIDIVMPLDRLSQLVCSLRAGGYALYTSWHVNHHSRGVVVECRLNSDGRLVRPRRLYVRRAVREPGNRLLDKIDLYPYRDLGNRLETCNSHRVLSHRAMQRSPLAPFDFPGYVNCLHLDNVANLKSTRSGAKHKLDCAVIREGPNAASAWFRNVVVAPDGRQAAPGRQ